MNNLRVLYKMVSGCSDCPAYTLTGDDCKIYHTCTQGAINFHNTNDEWNPKPLKPGFFPSDCPLLPAPDISELDKKKLAIKNKLGVKNYIPTLRDYRIKHNCSLNEAIAGLYTELFLTSP